jgi:hypothetical protein
LSESALITGTDASRASSSTSAWANTLARMTLLKRDKTRAVSVMLSFVPSWMSSLPRNSACPPIMEKPVSVDTRVRVLRF